MTSATKIIHSHDTPFDTVTLTYDDRFRRRMAMTTDNGTDFLLNLPEAIELRENDTLLLDDNRQIKILAAPEDLMVATCQNPLHLTRTAWHIGNRHLPCEIASENITLRWDHVIADMLEKLGCKVTRITGPFNPEGGAYGQGRTHGHSH